MPDVDPPAAPPARHPSALALHEYQLALLAPGDAEAIDRHLAACQRCRADLADLTGDQRRFDREVFPQTRAAVVRRRTRWRWWPALVPALAAAAAAWVLIAPAPPPDVAPKGDTTLAVFVATPAGPTAVRDGQTLHAGDRIRFVVRPAGQRHAVIASLDSAGRATIYHPWGGVQSAPLPGEARVELPGSIQLDASTGPERVFAVLAPRPFPTALVVKALEALARQGTAALKKTTTLPLALEAATQQSVLFEKSP